MLLHRLAADLGDLPLEAAHPGFAGVVANDVAQGAFLEGQLALLQAVGLDLLRNQVLGGDIDLLVLGVARQADDFHPIQQGRRDVHRVRGAEEHHVGQVVVDFQVVIVEVVVLLRVEHLEQRRGGIPAHVAAHLVDFVEEEQRVAHADLGHLLDQAARHGADIGTTVTADLGLVTHAAERHAHELAIGGAGDGFGQGGLAHAGRSHQAKDRALELLHPLLHGEILENALLDLFQAIMVGIEDVFRLGEIMAHLALGLPRHVQQPVYVGTHHGGFRRHRRHLLELVQLGSGLGVRLLGQAGGVDALLQLLDFVVPFVDIAEFLLNGLHLLIQVVLALAALHLLLDPAADTLFHLQQVDLGIQQRQDMLDPRRQVGDLQDVLLLLDLQRHVRGHGIDQPARLVDAVQRGKHLGGDFLAQLDVLLELAQQAASEDLGLALADIGVVDGLDRGTNVPFLLDEALDLAALLAFDQHLDGAIRQLEQLQHGSDRTHAVQAIFARIIVRGVFLRQQEDLLVAGHRCLQGLDGLFPTDEQRDDHVRVHHHVT
ncbi:Uncharacterised protein [Pseudomonas aeruginosa]|nr:Uncharacterised protein [Pseudomonas aeruginosa]